MYLEKLSSLSVKDIEKLINDAILFKKGNPLLLKNKYICNIFLEPSTRTKTSFIIAETNAEMKIINIDEDSSSFKKNETLIDTIITLKSMGIKNFVIRSRTSEHFLNKNKINDITIINGGCGRDSHPTQVLLDLVTIKEHFGKFKDLKILFCGDLHNSRVYHDNKNTMEKLGMKIFTCGPNNLVKNFQDTTHIKDTKNLSEFDIVMFLRVQHERHEDEFSVDGYNKKFGLNKDNIKTLSKEAIIMHPGPVNRGVEIENDLVYTNKSKITEQVKNGVYARMAILNRYAK